jgi:hypothetical protein
MVDDHPSFPHTIDYHTRLDWYKLGELERSKLRRAQPFKSKEEWHVFEAQRQ